MDWQTLIIQVTHPGALQCSSIGSSYCIMSAWDELRGMLTSRLLPHLYLADLQALAQASHATRSLVQVRINSCYDNLLLPPPQRLLISVMLPSCHQAHTPACAGRQQSGPAQHTGSSSQAANLAAHETTCIDQPPVSELLDAGRP